MSGKSVNPAPKKVSPLPRKMRHLVQKMSDLPPHDLASDLGALWKTLSSHKERHLLMLLRLRVISEGYNASIEAKPKRAKPDNLEELVLLETSPAVEQPDTAEPEPVEKARPVGAPERSGSSIKEISLEDPALSSMFSQLSSFSDEDEP